jgi:hypothetical protein
MYLFEKGPIFRFTPVLWNLGAGPASAFCVLLYLSRRFPRYKKCHTAVHVHYKKQKALTVFVRS